LKKTHKISLFACEQVREIIDILIATIFRLYLKIKFFAATFISQNNVGYMMLVSWEFKLPRKICDTRSLTKSRGIVSSYDFVLMIKAHKSGIYD
jgi:hypothetical protein